MLTAFRSNPLLSVSCWYKIEVLCKILQNYPPFLYPKHILDFNYWQDALPSNLAPHGHSKQRDLSKQSQLWELHPPSAGPKLSA